MLAPPVGSAHLARGDGGSDALRMSSEEPEGVEIDWRELSDDALRGLVESFVNREGTDYGAQERSFESKVEDVLRQLRSGDARVLFDPESESVTLVAIPK